MEDLCYLLKDVDGAGVYRLNCSLDALHDSVQRAGFVLFEADIATAHGKGEVLAELARAIKAPDWFGHNWDALADALGRAAIRPARIPVISNVDAAPHASPDEPGCPEGCLAVVLGLVLIWYLVIKALT